MTTSVNRGGKIAVYGHTGMGIYTFEPHAGGPAVAASRCSGYATLPRLDKRLAVINVPPGTVWQKSNTLGGDLVSADGSHVSAAAAMKNASDNRFGFSFSGRS